MNIGIVAGEASGDALGAGLMEAILRRVPDARFQGIAGPRMMALGAASAIPMDRLSVMGLFEVAGRYLELVPARARLARTLAASRLDAFVGIDAPDFNLVLEGRLRRAGVPVAHYVSPSVWAWRRHRLKKISASIDLMLCLLPFEPALYEAHGTRATFVGHPLADRISADDPSFERKAARQRLGLAMHRPTVALLPGSRMTEVSRLAAPLAGAADWLRRREPDLQFVVPLANQKCGRAFREGAGAGMDDARCMHLLEGRSLEAMAAADVVVTASGTASLEAMLVGRPMVITYRAMEMTWQIARRLSYVSLVGLPNLLAGRALVPELLQDEASPERLGAATLRFLRRPDLCAQVVSVFADAASSIRRDADQRAAEAVLGLSL